MKQLNEETILSFLPPQEREYYIIRRRLDGLNNADIAKELGVSKSTVTKYYRLAKIKLACCVSFWWDNNRV